MTWRQMILMDKWDKAGIMNIKTYQPLQWKRRDEKNYEIEKNCEAIARAVSLKLYHVLESLEDLVKMQIRIQQV